MRVVVVDYGSGNLASAARALQVAADRAGIAADIAISADPVQVAAADRVVLPGQGAFAACARGLSAAGLHDTVAGIVDRGRPLFGICVGMQLMAERGLEHDVTPGFGWITGEIAPMHPPDDLRLPQMGWNELHLHGAHPLLAGLHSGDHAYFVHSYALQGGDPAQCIASTDYGGPVTAFVVQGAVAGTQFHVEKSQDTGLAILANFLRWSP